jgi:hypothetical protein
MPTEARIELVEVQAKIPRPLYERFKAVFPFHGASTYVITSIIEELVSRAEQEPSLREHIRDSIRRAWREGR